MFLRCLLHQFALPSFLPPQTRQRPSGPWLGRPRHRTFAFADFRTTNLSFNFNIIGISIFDIGRRLCVDSLHGLRTFTRERICGDQPVSLDASVDSSCCSFVEPSCQAFVVVRQFFGLNGVDLAFFVQEVVEQLHSLRLLNGVGVELVDGHEFRNREIPRVCRR